MVNSFNVYRIWVSVRPLASPPCCSSPFRLPVAARKSRTSPPVATPSVTFSRDRVALGSPVKVTYRFQVAPNATFDRDYWVFVHVLNPAGRAARGTTTTCRQRPRRQWKPGMTVEYTRTVFVPNYPYIGEANVRIGLYSQADGKRLVLQCAGSVPP